LRTAEIFAAGAVLWRPGADGPELGLIHRPRYGDWSFPKGKLKRGEHVLEAARREVFEETGILPVLGRRLSPSFYDKEGQLKRVDYWAATASGERIDGMVDPGEVDGFEWVPLAEAGERLTHERDRPVLDEFARGPIETVPIVFVRHAASVSKADWFEFDELRPLSLRGLARAAHLSELLAAFAPGRAHTASCARCVDTVLPYATNEGVELVAAPDLTSGMSKPGQAAARLDGILDAGEAAVICGHGETVTELIGHLCRRLDAAAPADTGLAKGSFWVFHTHAGRLAGVEQHD
jgi:8-oxo-(d)GTP phosphatase